MLPPVPILSLYIYGAPGSNLVPIYLWCPWFQSCPYIFMVPPVPILSLYIYGAPGFNLIPIYYKQLKVFLSKFIQLPENSWYLN